MSSVVAPGMARRSADIPLQQLLDAQRVPTAPRARRAPVGGLVPIAPGAEGEMVPYNPRARRMSTVMTSQRMLPTEASTLPLSAFTIPEEGMHNTFTACIAVAPSPHISQSINQSINLMSWGATGTQQTRRYHTAMLVSAMCNCQLQALVPLLPSVRLRTRAAVLTHP